MNPKTAQTQLPRRVSYVVTIYNKTEFIPIVVGSLAEDGGEFEREYIFIDDGSTDGSAEMLEGLKSELPGPVRVISFDNSGASAATNIGVKAASFEWIRLLDGDDLVVPGSTEHMLDEALGHGTEFAYGDLGNYVFGDKNPHQIPATHWQVVQLTSEAGLLSFIRNCPSNSSTILVSKGFYLSSGGCNEELVSPDQMLFLRLFLTGNGIHLIGPVALIPDAVKGNAPARLSSQVRRSRYESILALHNLISENPNLEKRFVDAAYKRAMSRAYNYYRMFGGSPLLSMHFIRYLKSKIYVPKNPEAEMHKALSAFTEDSTANRPQSWQTGAARRGQAVLKV